MHKPLMHGMNMLLNWFTQTATLLHSGVNAHAHCVATAIIAAHCVAAIQSLLLLPMWPP